MELVAIRKLLETGLTGCEIEVSGDSPSLNVRAVGTLFEGLNKVKRQQKVYGILRDLISTGELHAVTMQIATPAEQAE
jgi:acid stress-induced BolA-like protein IbaG/YrbA